MEELIKKAQQGDEECFTAIIIEIEQNLYKVARMRLNCNDDIDEAIQETIIQAFKSIKKLKKTEFFKSWIIKILINNCNKIYLKKIKHPTIEYNEKLDNDTYSSDININNLDFYILIKTLNYKERISLTLRYLEDLTTKEISKILHEPESTIRNRISRAILKLKKIIKESDYNGSY